MRVQVPRNLTITPTPSGSKISIIRKYEIRKTWTATSTFQKTCRIPFLFLNVGKSLQNAAANVVHSVTENPESKLQNVPKQIIPNPSMPINAHQCPSMPKGGTCTRRRHCLICLSFKFWCIVWSKSNIHPAIVQDLIDPADVDGFRRFDAPNWTKQVRIDGKIGQNHPNKVESSIFKPRSSSPSTRNLRKAEV